MENKKGQSHYRNQPNQYSHFDYITQFGDAIESATGRRPTEIIPDGKIHRFSTGPTGRDLNGWYVFHIDQRPAGAFGCFREGFSRLWKADSYQSLSPLEQKQRRAEVARQRQRRELEERQRQEKAAMRALAIWVAAAAPNPNHPYLLRKGMEPLNLRTYLGALLVPLQDINGKIWSLQFIDESGSKRYLLGGRKFESFFLIGEIGDTVIICEGVSTGAALHRCTGLVVICAMDAGGLLPVARKIRERYPNATIHIGADNDQWKAPPNTGCVKGYEAAQVVRGNLVFPQFTDATNTPTDFCDLMLLEGADEVRRQLIEQGVRL